MTTTNPYKILVRHNGDRPVVYGRFSAAASEDIYPGMPLVLASATTVAKAASTDAWGGMVAVESPFADTNTSPSIEQAYEDAENVAYVQLEKGDEFYAILATSQTIAVGDTLTIGTNDGEVAEVTLDATSIVGRAYFVAMEAVTTTAATARLRVKVL